jgi:autotransporter-associated beta strand protein
MRATRRGSRPVLLASFAVFLTLVAHSGFAVTKTWSGVSSTSWSDGANWTPAGAPVPGDDLVFPGGAGNLSNNNNIAAGTSFNSITFTGASGGYSLGGNAIQLSAGGITANNTSGFNVVTLNIALAASQTFSLQAELDLNGNLDLGANNLVVDGSGATSFFQAVISGSGSLTKNGTATLVYAGTSPNTLTGTTTVDAGTLRLNKPAGVDAIAGPLVIGDGVGNDIVSLAHTEQIGDLVDVTINASGTLDFATFGATAETIGSLAGSGRVETGILGSLTTGGNGFSTTFSGVISGGGSLIKLGVDGMVLTGANTHTGPTSIMQGILAINGSEVGPIVVANAAALLEGTGTVVSLNAPLGFVAPGFAEPGIFNVSADAQIAAGATLGIQLFGPAVGTLYDQLNVAGTVTLGGNLNVTFGPPPPIPRFVPTLGSTFTIINNGGADAVVGAFAGLPEGATFTVESTTFRISYVGGTGNDVVLTAITGPTPSPTPTPTSAPVPTLSFPMMLLLVVALAACAVLLMRRTL